MPKSKLGAFPLLTARQASALLLMLAGGQGAVRAGLTVGSRADFVVLDADPLQVELSALLEIAVSGTYLESDSTYSGAD